MASRTDRSAAKSHHSEWEIDRTLCANFQASHYDFQPIWLLLAAAANSLLFQPNVAGCSAAPEVTDCCPKTDGGQTIAREHENMPMLQGLWPGTRFRLAEMPEITGVLVNANQCRAVVRHDRPERDVEFSDQEGQPRRFVSFLLKPGQTAVGKSERCRQSAFRGHAVRQAHDAAIVALDEMANDSAKESMYRPGVYENC